MTMRRLGIYSGTTIFLLGTVWFLLMIFGMSLSGGGIYILRHRGSVYSSEFLWQTFGTLVGVWAVFMGMLVFKRGLNTKKDL